MEIFFLNEHSDYLNSSSYSEVNFSWNYIEVGDQMPAYCLNFHNSETSTSCDRHHLPVAIAIAFHNSAVSWRGAIVCQSSGLKQQVSAIQCEKNCYKGRWYLKIPEWTVRLPIWLALGLSLKGRWGTNGYGYILCLGYLAIIFYLIFTTALTKK